MTLQTSILATYKSVDGWHVFQADDMPGLYVASKDPVKAFNDVALSIKTLVKLDTGVECTVTPERSVKEFIASIKAHEPKTEEPEPIVLSNKRFAVSGVAA